MSEALDAPLDAPAPLEDAPPVDAKRPDDERVIVFSCDPGRRNLGLCLLERGKDSFGANDTILEWTVMDVPINTAVEFEECLSKAGVLEWMDRCTDVLIERQMSRNPGASRVMSWMEMLGAVRQKRVVIFDARHKLTFAARSPYWLAAGNNPHVDPTGKFSHYVRKKLSVGAVQAFLKMVPQDEKLAFNFLQCPKKDDMSDALLQALSYSHEHREAEMIRRTSPFVRKQKFIKSRMPTPKQRASGKFTANNIAWLLRREIKSAGKSPEEIEAALLKVANATEGPLHAAIVKHFRMPEICAQRLSAPKKAIMPQMYIPPAGAGASEGGEGEDGGGVCKDEACKEDEAHSQSSGSGSSSGGSCSSGTD